jgi:hypothetical protein
MKISNVSELKKAIRSNQSKVIIEQGIYELDEPIVLNGLKNMAFEGSGNVVISGGKHEMNRSMFPNSIFVNGIRRFKSKAYNLPAQGWNKTEREDFIFSNTSEDFADGSNTIELYKGYITTHEELLKEKAGNMEFIFNVGWTQNIANGEYVKLTEDGIFLGLNYEQFRQLQTKINTRAGAPTEIANLKSALKEGTFYHDKSEGTIEYIPTDSEKKQCDIIYPYLENILTVTNCENITFKNIKFQYTTWEYPVKNGFCECQSTTTYKKGKESEEKHFSVSESAVIVEYSDGISFSECEFSKLGGAAIHIGRGSKNTSITDSDIFDIGACGLIIGGFDYEDAHPKNKREINFNTLIKKCNIHDVGRIYNGACGILAGYVNNLKILDNLIYNIAYTGISLGWGWGSVDQVANLTFNSKVTDPPKEPSICKQNIIRGNEIHHIMTVMHDGAAIYTLSNQDGSYIEDNYIHDNGGSNDEPIVKIYRKRSYITKGTTKWGHLSKRKGFPGGIYLDECSAGFTVRNNRISNVAVNYYYHDTGVPGIFEANSFDVEVLDNPIISED